MVKGDFSTYDVSQHTFDGIYGYVLDRIQGSIKYGTIQHGI